MKTKRHWVALVTIVVIAWLGVREYRCKLRGTAFAQQLESIKRDAAKDLRVGTNKTEVGAVPSRHANLAFTGVYKTPLHGWCYPPFGRVV